MQYKKLENGVLIPNNGFGCFGLEPGEETKRAVINAIEAGYRHIDTAWSYKNEKSVGLAIKDCIARGIIKREDVFVTTKLTDCQQGYNNALKAFKSSMSNLDLGYIDMYMIHTPGRHLEDWEHRLVDTWCALENIYRSGDVRAIGVSQFEPKHLNQIMAETEIKPMVDQLEVHPMVQQRDFVKYCEDHGILVSAWGAFNRGAVFKEKILQEIAEKYNKTVGQIVLRWSIQKGFIPVSRTTNIEHLKTNLDIENFELDDKTMKLIDSMDRTNFDGSSYGPYRQEKPEIKIPLNSLHVQLKKMKKTKKIFLFGFIPFLKIKNKDVCKLYLWGIPILTIKEKK